MSVEYQGRYDKSAARLRVYKRIHRGRDVSCIQNLEDNNNPRFTATNSTESHSKQTAQRLLNKASILMIAKEIQEM